VIHFCCRTWKQRVTRIFTALDQHERIVLFGDYDVDGVTSLALLAETLRGYGVAPDLFLPLRMEEGYGLSRESVERCIQQYHPQLLIALDCGNIVGRGDCRSWQTGHECDCARSPRAEIRPARVRRDRKPKSRSDVAFPLFV